MIIHMFEGFQQARIQTDGPTIDTRFGGSGPPVLLLHGYPQTKAMWHLVAPRLAERYTIVATDLRGYGDSDKPPGDPRHETYSKRASALDQVQVMAALGFQRFTLIGHDRGGRVGHRMALDHPDAVERLAVLDIVPTHEVFRSTDERTARAYYHWFFLSQPFDLPERLIGGDPVFYLERKIGSWSRGLDRFADEALAEYRRCFADPATIHATCEDYRAGATIDLEHDEADMDRRVQCPVLVLWGEHGFLHKRYDVVETWRRRADDVRGDAIPSGHFLPEEAPEETTTALLKFLAE